MGSWLSGRIVLPVGCGRRVWVRSRWWGCVCRVVAGWSRLRGLPAPQKRAWLPLALIGLLTEGICNAALAWSAQWLPSGLLAILIATTPFWMVTFEALLPGGERLRCFVNGDGTRHNSGGSCAPEH